MKSFDAVSFLHIRGWIGWYEIFKDSPVAHIPKWIVKLTVPKSMSEGLGGYPNSTILRADRQAFDSVYKETERLCRRHDLASSLATAEKMRACLETNGSTYQDLYDLAIELKGRLIDEMSQQIFFSLSPREAEFFNNPRVGWEKIVERFPSALFDIEEAYKCFALSRYSAAVFHSLQIIEAGLIELGGFLMVEDPKSGWTAVSGALDRVIRKTHQERTPFERENFAFLEQMQGTVGGLKNAWRNKISHAQGKLTLMTSDFSQEVAEEILYASRAFMRRLADALDSLSTR